MRIFILALIVTLMSTLYCYLFTSGKTLGCDYLVHYSPAVPPKRLTRISFLISALIGIFLILLYPSVIDLWYIIGSVFIPGLLFPVLVIYIERFRISSSIVMGSIVGCAYYSIG